MITYRRPYYEKNIEKFKEAARRSYLKHKAEHNARERLWRKQNPERKRELSRRWQEANRDKARAMWRRYAAKHRERNRHLARLARAKRRKAEGEHTLADIADILRLQKHRCAYCRAKLRGREYHVDHIVPLSRNGTNWRRNLQITCRECNVSKYAKDPIDYARSLGNLL